MKLAVVGAGWAGLAAAVTAIQDGHQVTVFEATETLGGRAKALEAALPDGTPVTLDNGQHILIGAYTETLALMRAVGVKPGQVLLDLPMTLQFPDGLGLTFPVWPTPLDALGGIARARGWSLFDKASLMAAALLWRLKGFDCDPSWSVARLCRSLSPRVMTELIEPLCVSALNTPAARASASVFLRVLGDALFGVAGGSHLLLPKNHLSALLPQAAAAWICQHGGQILTKARVSTLATSQVQWHLGGTGLGQAAGTAFDAVIWATSAAQAAATLAKQGPMVFNPARGGAASDWVEAAQALEHEAIATVYAWAAGARLDLPMLALRSSAAHPAQFVFDRGALGGPPGLLAFVVSAAQGERLSLQDQVRNQARVQLSLELQAVQTVVEKRATFSCTPGLQRPAMTIAPGLLAAGDYVAGPYPATLEGAVRSGVAAARAACAQVLTLARA
jgi:squalene-associated FAD-dependent desaturase